MPANTAPIFPKSANNTQGNITSSWGALAKSDGAGTVGTDMLKMFTAGAEGSFVESLRLTPYATAAATNTNATVFRVFLSTVGSGATTAANTRLIAEIPAAVISAAHSTNAVPILEIPINRRLMSGEYLHVSTHTAPATNTGWHLACFGGDY